MLTTHQQVVDACREINRERNKKAALLDKEREAQMLTLQEQCYALGHVFTYSDDRFQLYQTGRRCVFCGAPEPVANAEQGA